jgi:hypothetical protein
VKWSILIVTIPERSFSLACLLGVLQPQVARYEDVEIIVKENPGYPIGDMRRTMMELATGEYINFIDDDDMVPSDYVGKIYPLLDGVDYIGFVAHVCINGSYQFCSFNTIQNDRWWEVGEKPPLVGWQRDIVHLNPIRRELALRGEMSGGRWEDKRWADSLRALHIVRTEHYIPLPDVMYFYYYSVKQLKEEKPGDSTESRIAVDSCR